MPPSSRRWPAHPARGRDLPARRRAAPPRPAAVGGQPPADPPGGPLASGRVPGNLLVHGDCLDVLPSLGGGARLAYLDPPFNTGERFADFHDAMDRRAWLAAMEPRLGAAWALLREDGSLWVHCDDAEQAALRVLLDDAFGRAAFVATVVWQKRYSRENRLAFSGAHDYLHVYAPAGASFKRHRNRLPRADPPGTWRAGDERGPWSTVSLVAQGGHG